MTDLYANRRVRTAFDTDGSAVVLSLLSSKYLFLTTVAGYLWKEMLTGVSLNEAIQVTASYFEVAPEVLERDMQGVVKTLRSYRILEQRG